MQLIHCPACSHQVSSSAKKCVSCGHPLSRSFDPMKLVGYGLVVLTTLTLIVGGVRIAPVIQESLRPIGVKATDYIGAGIDGASFHASTSVLDSEDLQRELMAYAIRVNRLTPYKPNPMVTLQQLVFDQKPAHLIYEYELNVMNRQQPVDFSAITPIHEKRYCTSEELKIASQNRVPVTWKYYDEGRLVFENTVNNCGFLTSR